jgi:hypothetical protein
MISEKLKQGIFLEKSKLFIKWHTPQNEYKSIAHPMIEESGERINFIWKGESLLGGLEGDWTVSYFQHELVRLFKSISLFYTGDKKSFEAYDRIKMHLLKIFGDPLLQNETMDEKEMKWEIGECHIHLYLFEMHAFRCSLTIGIG